VSGRAALPLILLPPSEAKAVGGAAASWTPGTMALDLDEVRLEVLVALERAMRRSEADRRALLGVKGSALELATAANRDVRTSPTLPAIERYTGVLYDALDVGTLPATSRRRLNRCVLVFSGLWGAVSPSDPVPDYKLKMGASLSPVGRLARRWAEPLTAAIEPLTGGRRVWNLLPNEHDGAWRPRGDVEQVSVEFVEPGRDGRPVTVAHWNKFLKGSLVRHLLAEPTTAPEDLAHWEHPEGFRYDARRCRSEHDRMVVVMSRGL
jgi:cytoplasmic iron level regulating protein YaaA (DUF328/UPF0246 family)